MRPKGLRPSNHSEILSEFFLKSTHALKYLSLLSTFSWRFGFLVYIGVRGVAEMGYMELCSTYLGSL
jgi:hypothetical protein